MGLVRIAAAAVVALAAACTSGLEDPEPPPDLDVAAFRCNVQPVLAARCAFMECHATATRPLRLFAVQRMRLDVPWTELNTLLTDAELAANYDVARGFASVDGEPSLLLAKPLDTRAGGYYHRGQDLYGDEDVFLSTADRGYQLIEAWLAGETADPTCLPTQEVGP